MILEILVYTVYILILTAVLAATIWGLCEEGTNPFKDDGHLITWGKCLGLVVAVSLVDLVPEFGFWLSLGAWYLGIMILFQKTFGQTFIITCVNKAIGWGVLWVLLWLLSLLSG